MTYLSDNLAVLNNKNPSLAAALEQVELPAHIRLTPSRSGTQTLQFQSKNGQIVFLHSADDPSHEADRLCADHSFKNEDATILFGFGLGYLAKAVLALKEPRHLLCIVERYPALFKSALEHTDLTALLADENVYFFLGDAVTRLADEFGPLRFKALSGKIHKLTTPAFAALYQDHYADFEQRLHAQINSIRFDFFHSLKLQHILLTNLFLNIPCLPQAVALNELTDVLQNRPAVVVAGGPSLDQEMDHLRSCAAEVFLISSDTALKPLLQNRIIPDLVVTCDPTIFNERKLDGLEETRLANLPLLFRMDAHPSVVKRFKQFKIMVDADSTVSRWIANQGRKILSFPRFQSVAHLGFLAARQMGADPIILVGLDLSFPDDRDHATGTSTPWNMQSCQGLLKEYPGSNGRPVKTLESFISMIHIFEQEIAKTRARCINTSKNGALIKGLECLPLPQALLPRKASNGAKVSACFQIRLRDAIAQLPIVLKDDYQHALQWFAAETQVLETIRQKAVEKLNLACDPPPAEANRVSSHLSLLALYDQVFGHRTYLNIIADCLPYYQLSFQRAHPQGLPMITTRDPALAFPQIRIFFEELGKVTPLLQDLVKQIRF